MPPPDTLPANFDKWDAAPGAPTTLPSDFNKWDAPRKTLAKYASDFGTHLASGLQNAIVPIVESSAPNIALQLWKHLNGEPNTLKNVPAAAVQTFLMSGGFEGEGSAVPAKASTPEAATAGNVLEHPGVKPWVQAAKAELMKIPGTNFLKTAYESARGFAEGSPEAPPAPVAKPPQVPTGEANPEQFSFSHRITGRAYAPPGPAQFSTLDFTQPLKEVVDQAVPPSNKTANLEAHAKVQFYLTKGDVAAAEAALDGVAKKVNPSWPPDAPTFRGGVNDIRESTRFKTPADLLDDHAIQQEMQQNLEKHGNLAEDEAIKEFIARNSTGMTKAELTGKLDTAQGRQIRAAIGSTATPGSTPETDDLTPILQESLKAARKAKISP